MGFNSTVPGLIGKKMSRSQKVKAKFFPRRQNK